MKPIKSLLLLAAFGLMASPLLQAQDQAATPPEPSTPPAEGRRGKGRGPADGEGKQGKGQMMNPEARVAQLDRELSLTADQKTKLTDIFAKQRDEMEAMRGTNKGDREGNRDKMQSMMQSNRTQIESVLTDEQKKKFEARPQGGRGGADGDRPRGGPGGGQGGGQGKRKKDK